MNRFVIRIAQKTVAIECHCEFTEALCRKFLLANPIEKPDLTIKISASDILSCQRRYPDRTPECIESYLILKQIGEWLPGHGCFLLHGAAIDFQGQGYIFMAPSGTGKSTHIRLWKEYLGQAVNIVNGDKPVISMEDSFPVVWGMPWAGKEDWKRNVGVPLKTLCFLERSEENAVFELSGKKCLDLLFGQVYLSKNSESAALTLELLNQMLSKISVYLLKCNMEEAAVQCAFEGLTGLPYSLYKKE